MKKTSIAILSVLLAIATLLTACTSEGQTGDGDSEKNHGSSSESLGISGESEASSSQYESEGTSKQEPDAENEVYTDLSADFDPQLPNNDAMKVFATSTGADLGKSFIISFDGNEENYSFAPFGLSGLHDSYSCDKCGYVEKNGTTAFYICDDSGAHSGITIKLKTPIKSELVTGVTATVMTADEITNASQLRIQPSSAADASNVVNLNGYPDVSGAVSDWMTIDFKFTSTHIKSISDSDGYISEFKIYFRDKDATELYIKNITFATSIDNLCKVESLAENTFSRGDALQAIADKIAEKLTAEGVAAQIELRCSSYSQSTSTEHGSITYKAIITTDSSKMTVNSVTAILKKTEGEWLPQSSELYGTLHDSKEQWKTNFDKSGILFLEDNVLKAGEKLDSVEYAVISEDADVMSDEIKWFAPQILEVNGEGIDKLFINAYLDYGHRLIEGADYRFVVRGVTENQNYILHLDIPFKYSPISTEAVKSLEKAAESVALLGETFANNMPEDVEAYIKEAIEETVNDDKITVSVEMTASGVNSGRYRFTLSYNGDVSSSRFPSYTLDGVEKSNFFDFSGEYFAFANKAIYYDHLPAMDISLQAPYDGMENIRIASDEVVRLWNTDSDILITYLYDYALGELCDPKPVRLEWTSKLSGAYTVKVSEQKDLSSAWTFETENEYFDVYNLKAGTRYYWRVECGDIVSKTYTFVTEAGYPRYILSDKVSNFRDIGGHLTLDGKRVKQGIAFRFSNFDSVSEADKVFINSCLGIRTELDLRGQNSTSPLGSGVQAIPVSIQWYGGIFNDGQSEPLRQAISVFANEENYPIGYHCAIGRDRTGTVTILILGLLGVDEDTILKEFMISKISVSGGGDLVSARTLHANYMALINGLNNFGEPEDSFKDRVETYLLSIGITEEEIESIRSNLLED